MPGPIWDFAPQKQNGGYEQGFDRRPSETRNWQPSAALGFPKVTEPGGAMLVGADVARAGMGDFFSYPAGADAADFMAQQVTGPVIMPEHMDESGGAAHAGSMPWESAPAPWEVPGGAPGMPPAEAPGAIAAMEASNETMEEAKALEAAQAAKIATDNAVRAAVIGAPKVASTNAATAQLAANVAAGCAKTHATQRIAAAAQAEATKAVAAANVAVANSNGKKAAGMNDWFELSGMGGMSGVGSHMLDKPLGLGFTVKHALFGAAILGGLWYWKKGRK